MEFVRRGRLGPKMKVKHDEFPDDSTQLKIKYIVDPHAKAVEDAATDEDKNSEMNVNADGPNAVEHESKVKVDGPKADEEAAT